MADTDVYTGPAKMARLPDTALLLALQAAEQMIADLHFAMAEAQARHARQLKIAEEAGYVRGMEAERAMCEAEHG